MKKLFVLLAALAMTACSAAPASSAPDASSAPASSAAPASGSYTIGVNQFGQHPSLDNCYNGFMEGLKQEGIVEGENLKVDLQNAGFSGDTANIIAQSQSSAGVDLMCAIATPSAQASFNAADNKIPVVFTAVTDPVAAMLDEGEVTGTSDKLPVEEQLKMIRALMPEAKTIGILYTTSEVNSVSAIETYKTLAPNYGFTIVESGVAAAADIPLATADLVSKSDCLSNLTDNTVVGQLPVLLDEANAKGIPVFGSEIEQVKNGCAAAEGLEYYQLGIQTGKMAAKILKGETKASELPFEVIAESSLYLNAPVLEELGIAVPDDLAARGQQVG